MSFRFAGNVLHKNISTLTLKPLWFVNCKVHYQVIGISSLNLLCAHLSRILRGAIHAYLSASESD